VTMSRADEEALGDCEALERVMADRQMDPVRFCATAATMLNELGHDCPEVRPKLQNVVRMLLDDLAEQDREEEREPRDERSADLRAITDALRTRGLSAVQSCEAMFHLVIALWRQCPDSRPEINFAVRVMVGLEPGLLAVAGEALVPREI